MFGYIEPFYVSSETGHEAGQIWADEPLYMPPKHGMTVDRVDERDDRKLNVHIGGRTADTFDHPPIHSLKLESSEALVVARAKRNRPVVILGGGHATDIRLGQRPSHTDVLWVVPVYGADQFDEALRRRIQIYDFGNLFYLPADLANGFDEGFARLDHAQSVRRDKLVTHRGLRLSSDALEALTEWFIYFATDRIDPGSLILEYRREQAATHRGSD